MPADERPAHRRTAGVPVLRGDGNPAAAPDDPASHALEAVGVPTVPGADADAVASVPDSAVVRAIPPVADGAAAAAEVPTGRLAEGCPAPARAGAPVAGAGGVPPVADAAVGEAPDAPVADEAPTGPEVRAGPGCEPAAVPGAAGAGSRVGAVGAPVGDEVPTGTPPAAAARATVVPFEDDAAPPDAAPPGPAPEGPAPVGPAPEDPGRAGPALVGPAPEDPGRAGPALVGPAPEDPGRANPARADPDRADRASADAASAAVDAAESAPTAATAADVGATDRRTRAVGSVSVLCDWNIRRARVRRTALARGRCAGEGSGWSVDEPSGDPANSGDRAAGVAMSTVDGPADPPDGFPRVDDPLAERCRVSEPPDPTDGPGPPPERSEAPDPSGAPEPPDRPGPPVTPGRPDVTGASGAVDPPGVVGAPDAEGVGEACGATDGVAEAFGAADGVGGRWDAAEEVGEACDVVDGVGAACGAAGEVGEVWDAADGVGARCGAGADAGPALDTVDVPDELPAAAGAPVVAPDASASARRTPTAALGACTDAVGVACEGVAPAGSPTSSVRAELVVCHGRAGPGPASSAPVDGAGRAGAAALADVLRAVARPAFAVAWARRRSSRPDGAGRAAGLVESVAAEGARSPVTVDDARPGPPSFPGRAGGPAACATGVRITRASDFMVIFPAARTSSETRTGIVVGARRAVLPPGR